MLIMDKFLPYYMWYGISSYEKASESVNKWIIQVVNGIVCFIFRMRVKKLPQILALHLKRFKYMEQMNRFTKLSYRVVFPLELRLFNTVSWTFEAFVVKCFYYKWNIKNWYILVYNWNWKIWLILLTICDTSYLDVYSCCCGG